MATVRGASRYGHELAGGGSTHPLIGHWLTMLRHRETPAPSTPQPCRNWADGSPTKPCGTGCPIAERWCPTPGDTEGTLVEASVPLIAIPVLPAGFELWQGGRSVLPDSCLCLGSCPQEIGNAGVILFVDQISDGEATLKLLQELQSKGVDGRRLRLITALCASPGLKLL